MNHLISRLDATPVTMLPGLVRRTLAVGERAMICEFTADANVFIPLHSHPHEQIGIVLEGRVEFTVAGETFVAEAGTSYAIPGDVEHSALFLDPSVILEMFSPVRTEYL